MVDTDMISTGFGIAAIGIGTSIGLGAMADIIPRKKGRKYVTSLPKMKMPKFRL
jgi:hypothetical protein